MSSSALTTKVNARKGLELFEYRFGRKVQTISTSERFNEFLKIFPDKNSFLPLLCWLWVILGKYKQIDYVPKLVRNSANAYHALLTVVDNFDPKPYGIFAKLQILDETSNQSDSMIVDNINGYIINKIGEIFKNNFMKYIDSCITLIGYTGKRELTFPLQEMMLFDANKVCNNYILKNSTECTSKINEDHLPLAAVSFYEAIKVEHSLEKFVLEQMTNPNMKLNDLRKLNHRFATALNELFIAMCFIGNSYGFSHNDAHANNVLIRKDEFGRLQCVLIDYGRCSFIQNRLPSDLNLGQQIVFEINKHMYLSDGQLSSLPKTYNHFVKLIGATNYKMMGTKILFDDIKDIKGQNLLEEVRSMAYLFDVMTISMNIVSCLSEKFYEARAMKNNEMVDYIQQFGIYQFIKEEYQVITNASGKTFDLGRTSRIIIANNKMLSQILLNALKNDDEIAKMLQTILPGCMIFSLMIEYSIEVEKHLKDFKSNVSMVNEFMYSVDLQNYYNHNFISPNYVLMSLIHPTCFLNFYAKNRNVFKQADLIFSSRIWKKNAPNSPKTPMKTSSGGSGKKVKNTLKKEIKKVSKQHMRKYFGAGINGNINIVNTNSQQQNDTTTRRSINVNDINEQLQEQFYNEIDNLNLEIEDVANDNTTTEEINLLNLLQKNNNNSSSTYNNA